MAFNQYEVIVQATDRTTDLEALRRNGHSAWSKSHARRLAKTYEADTGRPAFIQPVAGV